MTWDFVEQNTFSVVFPSQKLYFYPDLSIELKLQCFWKTLKLARSEVAIPPAAVRVKIIYPAAGWITSYWPGKENKYDHDVSWHTVAFEWDLI